MRGSPWIPLRLCLLLLALIGPQRAIADDERRWYEKVGDELTQTYQKGDNYFYLPFRTYHMRGAYTRAQIDNYQEHPFGLGFGRGYEDEKEHWHGVYAMGFQDSHFIPQWMIGYNWMYGWRLWDDARVHLGYAAFITTRTDYAHYAPVPGAVPIASLDLHRVSLETSYVPGGKSFGNVLFFWFKFRLGS